MKHILTSFITLLISISSFAQQGINYKALIKDDLGNVLTNQELRVRFIIKNPDTSSEYIETHDTTSDANGIVILNIGEGNPGQFNDFNTIDWGNATYNLEVALRIEPSSNYIVFDETPFKTVPYALYAESVRNQTFKSESGITFSENTSDDFVFGSTQLDDTGSSLGNSRLFFDKGKASFRAGRALDDQWNDNNVGNRSVAFGLNTIASGTYSMAIGNRTKAESLASTAIGAYNVGGGNPSSWVGTDPLFEIGNGTATISTETRNNALTVLKNGKVGIGFNSENPTQTLDVSGKIKVSNDFTTPTPGTIRYNETANAFEGYIDGTGWVRLGGEKREKTIVIPASQFVAVSGSIIARASAVHGSNSVLAFNTVRIQAPVVIPINSKILNITYVFSDTTINYDFTLTLTKHCGDTTSETSTIVNLHSQLNLNSPNLFRYSYSTNETITAGCQYNITGQTTNVDAWNEGLRMHKVYITYLED